MPPHTPGRGGSHMGPVVGKCGMLASQPAGAPGGRDGATSLRTMEDNSRFSCSWQVVSFFSNALSSWRFLRSTSTASIIRVKASMSSGVLVKGCLDARTISLLCERHVIVSNAC